MEDRDRQAIEQLIETHPRLRAAYTGWQKNPKSYEWVELVFPGYNDSDDHQCYVLMNSLYAQSGVRGDKMRFAARKARMPDEHAALADELDVVSFYEKFSVKQLQIVGI